MNKINIESLKTGTIIVLLLVIVFGASYFTSELQDDGSSKTSTTATNTASNSGNDSSSDIPEDQQSDLDNIDIDEYLDLKKGDEASIIYIARPTCHYCQEEEPIVKNIVHDYNVTVNYLNTDELDDEGQAKLIKSDDYFSEGYGTPLLLVVKDNKIVDILKGLSTKETIIDYFKEHGFINE